MSPTRPRWGEYVSSVVGRRGFGGRYLDAVWLDGNEGLLGSHFEEPEGLIGLGELEKNVRICTAWSLQGGVLVGFCGEVLLNSWWGYTATRQGLRVAADLKRSL